jgi:hypothetical protein
MPHQQLHNLACFEHTDSNQWPVLQLLPPAHFTYYALLLACYVLLLSLAFLHSILLLSLARDLPQQRASLSGCLGNALIVLTDVIAAVYIGVSADVALRGSLVR